MLQLLSCCAAAPVTILRGFTLSTTAHSLSVSWTLLAQGNTNMFTVEIHGTRTVICDSTNSSPCTASGLASGASYLVKVINNTDDSVYQNIYYTGEITLMSL